MTEAEVLDYINSWIKKNGKKAITGDVLNSALKAIVQLVADSGGVINWGQIEGILLEQTDLQNALNSKLNLNGNNANANIDIGEFQIKADQFELAQSPVGSVGVAKIRWNDTDGTAEIGLKGGNVTLQLGQEQLARVVNKTSPLITLQESAYQAVNITGATGQRLSVKLAKADSDLNSASTIGLVTETIAGNQEGFVCTSGQVREINTTGSLQGETWDDGDILYLSGTTAGKITNIKPSAPIHTIIIGYVEYAHAIHGKIYVKVDNGYEIDELHNVLISSSVNGDTLEKYNDVWINSGIKFTIELVDALTVDFYAPFALKINSISNVLNSPTISILNGGASYTLGNAISIGSKITITANTASVVNLNVAKI